MLYSKHPILAVPMNKVSDLRLALACHSAGIYPSIALYSYYEQKKLSLEKFEKDLKVFKKNTGSTEILISMAGKDLLNESVLEVILQFDVLRIEIIEDFNHDPTKIKRQFPSKDILLVSKEIGSSLSFDSDVVIVKGAEAAGRVFIDGLSTEKKFLHFKSKYPNKFIIPSGGIGSRKDIERFRDLGAEMVGIGTLFAASIESPISEKSKEKIVSSTSADLVRFKDSNQNALLFGEIANDDSNHSVSLKIGTLVPDRGHLFMGHSIDQIDRIKSVAEIVEDLI